MLYFRFPFRSKAVWVNLLPPGWCSVKRSPMGEADGLLDLGIVAQIPMLKVFDEDVSVEPFTRGALQQLL